MKVMVINLMVFVLISLIITVFSVLTPTNHFDSNKWPYKDKKWEKNGEFYQEIFKVKKWKSHVPELADFVRFIFPKKHIENKNTETLTIYMKESCKAEATHWWNIMSSILFLAGDKIDSFIFIFIVSLMVNMPYIIIQRYNRPRIAVIIKRREERKTAELCCYTA